MALALDGHAKAVLSTTNQTTRVSAALTTTVAADVICLLTWFEDENDAPHLPQVSSISGLTWTKRFRHEFTNSNGLTTCVELWYATPNAVQSGATYTVTFTAATWKGYIFTWGVSGANTSAPFDTNGSLPAITDYVNATATGTHNVTFSTTNAADMLIAIQAGQGGNVSLATPDSGWTLIDGDNTVGTSLYLGAEYQVVSSAQSSVTQNVFSNNNSANWTAIVDAIQASSANTKRSFAPYTGA